jgi:hypothetical protein
MVAKRKTPKGERELPPIAHENPYAFLSREELDAAWSDVTVALEAAKSARERAQLAKKKGLISQGYVWRMVRHGIATWSGGKPRGTRNPVPITPGPYVSDYVVEDRG